jgi:thiol:disulfide interchange protein DsbD
MGRASVRPGEQLTVAFHMSIEKGWHTYWVNGGDAGFPLAVEWQFPPGFSAGPLLWPVPTLMATPPLMSYGYLDSLTVLVRVSVPGNAAAGTVRIPLRASWLVCAEVCLPAEDSLELAIRVSSAAPRPDARGAAIIAAAEVMLPRAPPAEWKTVSWKTDSGYSILVAGVGDAAFRAPYFFVDSAETLDHARAQTVRRNDSALSIDLRGSEFALSVASRLRGILSTDGSDQTAPSYVLDLLVAPNPDSAALLLAAQLRSWPPQETGGLAAAATLELAAGTLPPVAGTTLLTVATAISLAFIGGILLNLMPCVFPVLSLKVLNFVEHGAGTFSVSRSRLHALIFAAGVVVSFWALAGLLFALRAGGESLGWGFQLQLPAVVAVLALVLFLLALNMSGVFEIGLSLTRLGAVGRGRGAIDSFLTGGLAVVVAAPCTAPFMGAALGFAVVQPAALGLLVFTSLALGLAAPYVLLASVPALMSRLPRPGAWMVRVRQLLAFPMYATVVWLVWVFGRQSGVNSAALLLIALVVLALAAWFWAQATTSRSAPMRSAALLLLVASVATATVGAGRLAVSAAPATAASGWEVFSRERLAEARSQRRPVLVDFTAAWCLTCQVNERVAFQSKAALAAFASANVALLRADWTSRDAEIADMMREFGRAGVPLYVLYPSDPTKPPEILPTVLTTGIVVRALERAVLGGLQ